MDRLAKMANMANDAKMVQISGIAQNQNVAEMDTFDNNNFTANMTSLVKLAKKARRAKITDFAYLAKMAKG